MNLKHDAIRKNIIVILSRFGCSLMHVYQIRLVGMSLLLLFLMKSSESTATFFLVVFITYFSPDPLILLCPVLMLFCLEVSQIRKILQNFLGIEKMILHVNYQRDYLLNIDFNKQNLMKINSLERLINICLHSTNFIQKNITFVI